MIYQRAGSPKWQMRLKIPDRAGYVVKSTKQKDRALAEEVARKEYTTLNYKVDNNLEIKSYDFAKLYEAWWKRERPSKGEARRKYIEGTAKRYFLNYFGTELKNVSITALTDLHFEDYWGWRIGYWDSGAGQQNLSTASKRRNNHDNQRHSKKGNVAKKPSNKTLQMEQSLLKQIFWWAHRRGIIDRQPYIKAPKDAATKNLDTARRPTFDLSEYRQLYRAMRIWVKGEVVGKQPRENGNFAKSRAVIKRPHSLHVWQRNLIRNYVLFMANSGCRPNEARQLRWRDIRTTDDDIKYLYISPTTKTGERDTYPLPSAFRYLERVKEQSEYTSPDDLIFGDRDGKPVENFNKTFTKLLADNDLLFDSQGRRRTIYGLRHFYGTMRLSSKTNPVPMEVLAKNMGTSPATLFRHYRHLENYNYRDVLTKR
jgi:integrase